MNKMVHVCFGLHDSSGEYSRNVGAVMWSILEHTESKICFHIIVDNSVTEYNRKQLSMIVSTTESIIDFVDVDVNAVNVEKVNLHAFNVGTMLRLLAPQVLNIDKLIYLDADILVERDISELWNVDINDYALGAVHDEGVLWGTGSKSIEKGYVKKEDYFNAGVLLMNLHWIREQGNLLEQVIGYLKENEDDLWPDQGALNALYGKNTLLLDESWNVLTVFERARNNKLRKAIYHFAGDHEIPKGNTEYDVEMLKYQVKGPWDSTSILNKVTRRIFATEHHVELNQKLLGRLGRKNVKAIFYGPMTKSMRNLIQSMGTKYGDYFVLDDSTHDEKIEGLPVFPFSELLNEVKGAFVIFVLPEADNNRALDKLKANGFRENNDFFVVPCLMLAKHGGYIY